MTTIPGTLKETKSGERRTWRTCTNAGADALLRAGAGERLASADIECLRARARIAPSALELIAAVEVAETVREPTASEIAAPRRASSS